MTHEPDGVALEVEQLLTQAGQGVAELARAKAQRRTQALHAATRESAQRAAELNARIAAEQTTASAQLAGVGEPGWWERASAEQIVDAFATAEQWHDSDPQFAQAAQAIRGELKERFGIDPDSGADPGAKATVDRGPEGAEATEICAALADLRESLRVQALAGQKSVLELVRDSGPQAAPQARHSRGQAPAGAERERGR